MDDSAASYVSGYGMTIAKPLTFKTALLAGAMVASTIVAGAPRPAFVRAFGGLRW